MNSCATYALAFAIAAVTAQASAQSVSWTSDNSGEWASGFNWSTGTAPSSGASAHIDRGAANPVITLIGAATVDGVQSNEAFSIGAMNNPMGGALYLSAPSVFNAELSHLCCTLHSTSSIDVSGRLTLFNSTMSGGGITSAGGGIDLTGPWLFLLDGHQLVNFGSARAIANTLTTLTGIRLDISRGSSFVNRPGATMEIQTGTVVNATPHGNGAAGYFDNLGTIDIVGGPGAGFSNINNLGTINVFVGGLSALGAHAGVINGAAGTVLSLGGNFSDTTSINAGSAAVSLDGTIKGSVNVGTLSIRGVAEFQTSQLTINTGLTLDNGVLRLNTGSNVSVPTLVLAGVSLHNDTNFIGGVRGGTDTLNVASLMDWTFGTLVDAGTTNAFGGIAMRRPSHLGAGSGQLRGGHVLNNFATATWNEFGLTMNEGAVFNNKATGLVDLMGNFGIGHFVFLSPTPTFNNEGTLRKSGGDAAGGIFPTPASTITVVFNNSGAVEVDSGLLRLTGGGTSTGSFSVASGKSIEFAGGHRLEVASSVSASAANVLFSSVIEDRVAGAFQSGKTSVTGSVVFDGNAPVLGALEVKGGSLRLATAQASAAGGTALELGSIVIDSGSALRVAGGTSFMQTSGVTGVDGTLEAPLIDIRSGVLGGSGTIMGAVVSAGEIRPGAFTGTATTGTLHIVGSYEQKPSGKLTIELLGSSPDEFDVLQIDEVAVLGGILEVRTDPYFRPSLGSEFVVMTFRERTGSFAQDSVFYVGRGLGLETVFDENSLKLRVVVHPTPPNLFRLLRHLGPDKLRVVSAASSTGDTLEDWRRESQALGKHGYTSISAVPEPRCWSLMMSAVFLLAWMRKRQTKGYTASVKFRARQNRDVTAAKIW